MSVYFCIITIYNFHCKCFIYSIEVGVGGGYNITVNWGEQWAISPWCFFFVFFLHNYTVNLFAFLRVEKQSLEGHYFFFFCRLFLYFKQFCGSYTTCRLDCWVKNSSCQPEFVSVILEVKRFHSGQSPWWFSCDSDVHTDIHSPTGS